MISTPRSMPFQLFRSFLAVVAMGSLLLCGCGKKIDAKKQTSELEASFQGLASVQPATLDTLPNSPGASPARFIKTAVQAVRANDHVAAVIMLQRALDTPGTTPEQVMAIQAARKSWKFDLMTRAHGGDEGAKKALSVIESTH